MCGWSSAARRARADRRARTPRSSCGRRSRRRTTCATCWRRSQRRGRWASPRGGALEVRFSAMRGQRRVLAGGVVVIDDCYNANPMSMRAAIDDLAETARGRAVAVLGDMLELGPGGAAPASRDRPARRWARGRAAGHGRPARRPRWRGAFAGEAHSAPDARRPRGCSGGLLREGDTVLLKGSRGVGLERVVGALAARRRARRADAARVLTPARAPDGAEWAGFSSGARRRC